MKIVEYDDVDPVSVLQLTLLALDFALTPEGREDVGGVWAVSTSRP